MIFIPDITVLVCTIDRYQTVSYLMGHLRVQEGRERCELLIVCPDEKLLGLDPDVAVEFGSVQILAVGPIVQRGYALAAGIRAASAPVVALTEDHSFPQPGWLIAHMKAHEGPWAAVSATLINANPDSPMSWADILTGHGAIVAPQTEGQKIRLGGHNVSYKRDILMREFKQDLGEMLDTEPIHHDQLTRNGYKLFLSAEARVRHTNFETFPGWVPSQYYHGRLYASFRWRNWSRGERVKFLLGAPLSPAIRVVRMWRSADTSQSEYHRVPRLLHYLIIGITVGVFGEVVGCLFGNGQAAATLTKYEFKRYRFFDKRYHADNGKYE